MHGTLRFVALLCDNNRLITSAKMFLLVSINQYLCSVLSHYFISESIHQKVENLIFMRPFHTVDKTVTDVGNTLKCGALVFMHYFKKHNVLKKLNKQGVLNNICFM